MSLFWFQVYKTVVKKASNSPLQSHISKLEELETGSMNLSEKSGQIHIEKFEISNHQFPPFSNNSICNAR